jgi:osmotically inducible protein OsmC
MAFSNLLGEAGYTASSIDTQAEVTLSKQDDGFAITAVALTMNAVIPGIDQQAFDEIAGKAKEGCPVSKLLNAEISLKASLG